jgi:hypothetical protein
MLDFDADNILSGWDIDEKRFSSFSLVDYGQPETRPSGSATRRVDDKNR